MTDAQPSEPDELQNAILSAQSLRAAILAIAEVADEVDIQSDFCHFVFPVPRDRDDLRTMIRHEASWPNWVPTILTVAEYRAQVEEAFYEDFRNGSPRSEDKQRVLADLDTLFSNAAVPQLQYSKPESDCPVVDSISRIGHLEVARDGFQRTLRALPTDLGGAMDGVGGELWKAGILKDIVYPLEHWPFGIDGRLGTIDRDYPESAYDFVKLVLEQSPKDSWVSRADLVVEVEKDLRLCRDLRVHVGNSKASRASPEVGAPLLDESTASGEPAVAPTVDDIEKETPQLNELNGKWLKANDPKMRDEAAVGSLKSLRNALNDGAEKTSDGTFGIDKAGRLWRKTMKASTTVWYWRGTLKGKHRPEENEG